MLPRCEKTKKSSTKNVSLLFGGWVGYPEHKVLANYRIISLCQYFLVFNDFLMGVFLLAQKRSQNVSTCAFACHRVIKHGVGGFGLMGSCTTKTDAQRTCAATPSRASWLRPCCFSFQSDKLRVSSVELPARNLAMGGTPWVGSAVGAYESMTHNGPR